MGSFFFWSVRLLSFYIAYRLGMMLYYADWRYALAFGVMCGSFLWPKKK